MIPRKPHRKSRSGCLPCKSRHVKCGEEHPICTNCTDMQLTCCYPPPVMTAVQKQQLQPYTTIYRCNSCNRQQSRSGSRLQNRSVSEDRYRGPPYLTPNPSYDQLPTSIPASPSSANTDINTSTLTLLHHFTTSTYLTMSPVPTEQKEWQTTIVTLGLQHQFLLRGILALSALHLAYLNPGPPAIEYMIQASIHQDIGLSEFRRTFDGSISEETFDAILAFSCLLAVHSLTIAACSTSGHRRWGSGSGSGSQNGRGRRDAQAGRGTEQERIEGGQKEEQDVVIAFLDATALLRSVNALLLPSVELFPNCTLLTLLQITRTKLPEQPPPYSDIKSLFRLELACSQFCSSSKRHIQPGERQVFSEAIKILRSTYATTLDTESTDTFTIGGVLIWSISVSDEYFALLGRGHPCALAILAHFAVLLHRHDEVWWLKGLGKAVIKRVDEMLGEEWSEVISWPKIAAGLTV